MGLFIFSASSINFYIVSFGTGKIFVTFRVRSSVTVNLIANIEQSLSAVAVRFESEQGDEK
ncbi:hypothetical protein A2U01_0064453, partial [Trifolium medium]|nr:hypothetical protein [Trifolium medium]